MKVILVALSLNLICVGLLAQSTYYGINAGYASHIPGSTYVTNSNNQFETFSSNFDFYDVRDNFSERVNASYGSGLNVGVVMGKMLNPNFGFELGASYLKGNSIENSYSERSSYYYASDGSSYSLNSQYINQDDYSKSVTMYKLIPTLVFSMGTEGLSPYTKIAGVIGNGTLTSNSEGFYSSSDFNNGFFTSESYTQTEKYTGGFAFGFGTALGVSYSLNAATSIYVEGYFESLNYSPKRREITEYSLNGSNALDSLSTSEKEFDYVNEISSNQTNDESENEPTKLLRIVFPMSTAALRFGVNFHF